MINNDIWPELWSQYLDQYLSKPPRTGYWIDAHFGRHNHSFLELGCGSGRDALYLASRGHEIVGSDLDDQTLNELNERFERDGLKFSPQDATKLSFENNRFDVVYHNGLWVLFDDDKTIESMLREQVRVAKKRAVILVHNAENPTLRAQFKRRADAGEPLYDIRFFSRKDVLDLVERIDLPIRNVELMKFGGRYDLLYRAKRVKRVLPNIVWPIRHRAIPRLYSLEPWHRVERIACVLEL